MDDFSELEALQRSKSHLRVKTRATAPADKETQGGRGLASNLRREQEKLRQMWIQQQLQKLQRKRPAQGEQEAELALHSQLKSLTLAADNSQADQGRASGPAAQQSGQPPREAQGTTADSREGFPSLWSWSRHLHGNPRRWPYILEGCKRRIGTDPRAIPPQTDLGSCTLNPSKGKRKPVTVSTTVKKVDCLWSISRQLTGSGTNWKELVECNRHLFKRPKFDTPIDNSLFVIQPGWTLQMRVTPP